MWGGWNIYREPSPSTTPSHLKYFNYESKCQNTFTSHIDKKYIWHFCWLPYLYTFSLYENPCDRSVILSGHSSFIHQENSPPRYNWNIVERGIKYHTPLTLPAPKLQGIYGLAKIENRVSILRSKYKYNVLLSLLSVSYVSSLRHCICINIRHFCIQ